MARIDRLMRSGVVLVPVLLLLGLIFQVERRFRCNHREDSAKQELAHQQLAQDLLGARIRIKGKVLVLKELLAKRMTLLEAAAYFRAMDRRPPAFYWDEFRRGHEGNTDEERHCREVINWVQAEMDVQDPCLGLASCAQLEQQLRDHLQQGPVSLPEVELPDAFIDESGLDH